MKVLRGSYGDWAPSTVGTAVTVGAFDGVHLGHEATLEGLKERAEGKRTVVATFVPHPAAVLAPDMAPRLLTTPGQRARHFERLGIDLVAFIAFDDELRQMTAEDFVGKVLVRALGAEVIVVGADFRFGYHREGDSTLLADMAQQSGYEFHAVDLVGGETAVSSTRIRLLLSAGLLEDATELLGRHYSIEGDVVIGEGRGEPMGAATANLGLERDQFIPKRGVYAVMVQLGDRNLSAACNVGIRPTFGGSEENVEVHILNFDEDIRGEVIEVEFRHRLRDERTFDDVDALMSQIRSDLEETARLLGSN